MGIWFGSDISKHLFQTRFQLRDCELGATLNRELKLRIRAVSGITLHKQIMRNDIKIAAKIIQTLDKKQGLWEETEEEKKDSEKEVSVNDNSHSFYWMCVLWKK